MFHMVLRQRKLPSPAPPRTPRKPWKRPRVATPRTPRTRRVTKSAPSTPTAQRYEPYPQRRLADAEEEDRSDAESVLSALTELPEDEGQAESEQLAHSASTEQVSVDDRMDVETVRAWSAMDVCEPGPSTTGLQREQSVGPRITSWLKACPSSFSVMSIDEVASSTDASSFDGPSKEKSSVRPSGLMLPPRLSARTAAEPLSLTRPLERDVTMASVTSAASDASMATARPLGRDTDVSMASVASAASDVTMATARPLRRVIDVSMASIVSRTSAVSQVSIAHTDISMATARSDVTMRTAVPSSAAAGVLGTVVERPDELADFLTDYGSEGCTDGDDGSTVGREPSFGLTE